MGPIVVCFEDLDGAYFREWGKVPPIIRLVDDGNALAVINRLCSRGPVLVILGKLCTGGRDDKLLQSCTTLKSRGAALGVMGVVPQTANLESWHFFERCSAWYLLDDWIVATAQSSEFCVRALRLCERVSAIDNSRFREIRCGSLNFKYDTLKVSYKGSDLRLTKRETELLVYLMQHADRPVTRQNIAFDVWKHKSVCASFDSVLNGHVCRLREKLGDVGGRGILRSVRGRGVLLLSATQSESDELGSPIHATQVQNSLMFEALEDDRNQVAI